MVSQNGNGSAGAPHHPVGFFTRRIANPVGRFLTRRGISIQGSLAIEVVGRKTGEPRQTVVNRLDMDGGTYLVSPRGTTQWVRNLRAANGRCVLVLGKKRNSYLAEEITSTEVVPVLRAYLTKWAWEVGAFFPQGISKDSTDEELLEISQQHPVFRLERVGN